MLICLIKLLAASYILVFLQKYSKTEVLIVFCVLQKKHILLVICDIHSPRKMNQCCTVVELNFLICSHFML
uniref:Putative ovule protein n=1 Tax=Solanum chacoense TaxID=4108 RepID=A0A0V0HJL3_SOLCH